MTGGTNSSTMSLARRTNYINKSLKYIKNSTITEYDMESAGMNILTEMGYFKLDQREKLMQLPKYDRNVTIGKLLQRDKEMVTALEDGFTEARYQFIENNGIDLSDILSIKRDAIYVIGNYITEENISELIKITPDNQYTTYINILNREHYFNTNTEVLHVKGYSKKTAEILDDYLFKMLKRVLKFDISKDKDSIFIELIQFKDDLLSYNLPKEYYYDPIMDGYVITGKAYNYILPEVSDEDKKNLAYNNILRFINELINYVL